MTDKLGRVACNRPTAWMGVLVLLFLTNTAVARAQTANDQNRAAAVAAYKLQVGDVLSITILGWPTPAEQFEGRFPVESTGRAYLPIVGGVEVAGKTTEAVQAELRRRFAAEQSQAVVLVEPVFAVAVNGEVREPGVYDFRPGQTIFDALSRAGGYTNAADRTDVLLVRAGSSRTISASSANELATLLAEATLQSGDRLLVHPARRFYSTTVLTTLQVLIGVATLYSVVTR